MIQLKVYPFEGAPETDAIFLDLYETQPIKLTLSIEDVTSADATSVFSRTFKVPATRDNNEFFQNAWELDGIDFDITIKKPAEILVDGSEFKTGHVRLQKIFSNADLDKIDYELLFLGETRDFSSAVGESTLCQLTFTDFSWDGLPVNYTNAAAFTAGIGAQEVQDSWDAFPSISGGQTPTSGYADGDLLFPLIDHGNDYINGALNSETISIGGSGSSERSFTHASRALPASRFKPMVRAKRLWDQIFQDSGYTYESNFLDSEQFLHMYVSAFGNEENINVGVEQDVGGVFGGSASAETFEYFENPNGNNDVQSYLYCSNQVVASPSYVVNIPDVGSSNGGSYFTAPGNASVGGAFYAFEFGAQVDAQIENSDYGYTAIDSAVQLCIVDAPGGNILQTLDVGNFATNGNWSSSSYTSQNGGYQPQSGDIFQVFVTSNNSYDISQVDQAYWQCTAAPGNYSPARDLDCEYQQIDFIKDIITMFRLVMQPDPLRPNHFIIEPWKDFIGSGDVLDWSHKLIRQKDFISEPLFNTQSAIIEFTKQEDEDYINKFHQDNNKHAYGWLRFDSQNELLKGKREVEVLGIAPTPIEQIFDVQGSQAHTNPEFILPQVFEVDNNERLPIKPKTRFLFYNGMVTTSGTTWYFKTSGTSQLAMVTYPLVSPYEYWPIQNVVGPPPVNTLNLNFANDTRYYMDPTPDVAYTELPNTLFEIFWARYISSLYNKFSRRVTAYFTLNNVDLQNLTFDDIIFIDGKYYRPEKVIDAQIGERTAVKVQLINVLDQRPVWRPEPLTGFSIITSNGICAGDSGSIQVTTDGTPPFNWSIFGNSQTNSGTFNAPVGQAPYIFTVDNVPLGSGQLEVEDDFGRTATAAYTVSASSATPVEATWVETDATDCSSGSTQLFLDVNSNTSHTLGIGIDGYPNGYIYAENVVLDTYSAWNFYGASELWYSNTTQLDVTKDVIIEGSFTIEINTGANQSEWNTFRDMQLGVTVSNSGNFPGYPGADPILLQIADVVPTTVPTVGTQITIPFYQNIGPITPPSASHSYQSFGVMLTNQYPWTFPTPGVTGPFVSWITQETSTIKAYISDDCNGELVVTPSGGSGSGYTITWQDGGSGFTRTALCPDDYLFYITDALGCQSDTYEASISCQQVTYTYQLREHLNSCSQSSSATYIATSTVAYANGTTVDLNERSGCYYIQNETTQTPTYTIGTDYPDCASCSSVTPLSYEIETCGGGTTYYIDRSIVLTPGQAVEFNGACFEVIGDSTNVASSSATQVFATCADCTITPPGFVYYAFFCDGSFSPRYFASTVSLQAGDVLEVLDGFYIGKCVEIINQNNSATSQGNLDISTIHDDCNSCQGIVDPQSCNEVVVTGSGAEISYTQNSNSFTETLNPGTYNRCGSNFNLISGSATFTDLNTRCISNGDCFTRLRTSCHTLYGGSSGSSFDYQNAGGQFTNVTVNPFVNTVVCANINSVSLTAGNGSFVDNQSLCLSSGDCFSDNPGDPIP